MCIVAVERVLHGVSLFSTPVVFVLWCCQLLTGSAMADFTLVLACHPDCAQAVGMLWALQSVLRKGLFTPWAVVLLCISYHVWLRSMPCNLLLLAMISQVSGCCVACTNRHVQNMYLFVCCHSTAVCHRQPAKRSVAVWPLWFRRGSCCAFHAWVAGCHSWFES